MLSNMLSPCNEAYGGNGGQALLSLSLSVFSPPSILFPLIPSSAEPLAGSEQSSARWTSGFSHVHLVAFASQGRREREKKKKKRPGWLDQRWADCRALPSVDGPLSPN